ncbi:MAG: putative nucleotide-diphospho-sugar transferase [Pseudanabaena sp. ELA645]
MHQWNPQAYEYLLQKDYPSAVSIYEEAIADAPEDVINYFYLGLLQLLQGQESDAQFSWMVCINDEADLEQIDHWTSELVEILFAESQRQIANRDYETAWLICQHIHEIDQSNLDNSLTLVWLSIQLQTLDAESDVLIEVIESLTEIEVSEPDAFSHDLLWIVFASLLKYEPYPLLVEFTKACLTFVQETKNFVANLSKRALELAYHHQRDDLAIALLELCLTLLPEEILVLEYLSSIYLRINNHNQALETAKRCFQLSEGLAYSFYPNYLMLRALLSKGGDWQESMSVFATQQTLLSNLIKENPTTLSPAIIRSLYIVNYFAPYINDEAKLNRIQQNQMASLSQANLNYDLSTQRSRFEQRYISRAQNKSQKLKIGYISRCLATHSVGWLARGLIGHRDRQQFEVYGYFLGYRSYPDRLQEWYTTQMDHVYRAGIDGSSDAAVIANKIYQDQIDILIDLDSITSDLGCAVMALKPAPIQVSWLGCDASGLPTIDYFIADPYVLPDSAQEYYAERIWRLPKTYIAVDGFEVGVPSLRRDRLDIPADAIVYLSAQNAFKRHPDTIRLQMQIIKAVPNSYFLIKGLGDQDSIKESFINIAIAEGVNPEKLRFLPMTATEEEHRANLGIADIVLDTYPYNGATTTLETLWMCIPIVTKVGEQFAARNSYTMIVNAGISEGIAWNDAEYIEWGIRLGKDASLRKNIATRLKAGRQTAPLWNAKQFTRDMESAYQQMWQQYVQSIPTKSNYRNLDRNLDANLENYRIVLLASGGLDEFVENTIKSISNCNIALRHLEIFTPKNVKPHLEDLLNSYSVGKITAIEDITNDQVLENNTNYHDIGTDDFGKFTIYKWIIIKNLLNQGIQNVIYTDVDIAWRINPIELLQKINKNYDLAIQTEGEAYFPPHFCTGFMSFSNTAFSRQLLDSLIELQIEVSAIDPTFHDQFVFNTLVDRNVDLVNNIFPLSEILFANGLAAKLMTTSDPALEQIQKVQPKPMVFHANCTVGLENKKKMLQKTGNWLL